MNIISAERWAQIKAFGELQNAAHEILTMPAVQQQLGDISLRLLDMCDNAFLPDVHNGLVVIPPHKIDTDDIPLLPTTFDGSYSSYYAGPSVVQPTLSSRNRVISRFEQHGKTASDAEQFIGKAIGNCEFPILLTPEEHIYASIFQLDELHPETGALLSTRPMIVGGSKLWGMLPVETGLVMGHELSHVDDMESGVDLDVDILDWFARTETRAYHREVLMMEGLEASGWDTDSFVTSERAVMIDALRHMHATPEDPYHVTPQLIADLREHEVIDQGVLAWIDGLEVA